MSYLNAFKSHLCPSCLGQDLPPPQRTYLPKDLNFLTQLMLQHWSTQKYKDWVGTLSSKVGQIWYQKYSGGWLRSVLEFHFSLTSLFAQSASHPLFLLWVIISNTDTAFQIPTWPLLPENSTWKVQREKKKKKKET